MSFCKSLFAFSFGSFVPASALALDFAFAFAFGVAECPALIVAKPVSRISPTAFFPVSAVTLPFALTLVLAREASAPHRSRCNDIAQVTACAIAIFLLVSHPTKDPHQQTTHHNPRKDAIAGFFLGVANQEENYKCATICWNLKLTDAMALLCWTLR